MKQQHGCYYHFSRSTTTEFSVSFGEHDAGRVWATFHAGRSRRPPSLRQRGATGGPVLAVSGHAAPSLTRDVRILASDNPDLTIANRPLFAIYYKTRTIGRQINGNRNERILFINYDRVKTGAVELFYFILSTLPDYPDHQQRNTLRR